MKWHSLILAFSIAANTASNAAVTVFQDDFSVNSLAADYVTQNVTYNATPDTVTISRGSGSNFLQIADPFTLDTFESTELTVSFNFSFGASMFGSGFQVQYNDGTNGWQTIASQGYTGTGANDSANATNFLTTTINEGATYTFSDSALVRIIGTTNTGGKGYHIDNLLVEVDTAIPEPAAALLGSFGLLALLRRRR